MSLLYSKTLTCLKQFQQIFTNMNTSIQFKLHISEVTLTDKCCHLQLPKVFPAMSVTNRTPSLIHMFSCHIPACLTQSSYWTVHGRSNKAMKLTCAMQFTSLSIDKSQY